MTFLPVITKQQYDNFVLKAFTDLSTENKAMNSMEKHNPGVYYALLNCITGIISITENKLDDKDMGIIIQLIKISFCGAYGLMDEEAEKIALEKVGVKSNLN